MKKGPNSTLQKIQEVYTAGEKSKRDPKETLREVMQMFPPIMHRWFVNTFVVPADWFEARTAFAHTAAVWSMVGHIVGLGDRHGENLLLDSVSGDVVHVDFSCLFDKARGQRRIFARSLDITSRTPDKAHSIAPLPVRERARVLFK